MDAATRTMETMPEPSTLVWSIPDAANRTIMKAMSLRPEDRQQRISEFMGDLLNVEKNPSRIETHRKEKAKKKKPINIGNTILVVILALVFIAIGVSVYNIRQEQLAEEEKNRQEQLANDLRIRQEQLAADRRQQQERERAAREQERIRQEQMIRTPITLNVSKRHLSFSSSGGNEQITITSNIAISYSVSDLPSWCTAQLYTGYLVITCRANQGNSTRTDYFTITAGNKKERINISQSGTSNSSNLNNNDSPNNDNNKLIINPSCSRKTISYIDITKIEINENNTIVYFKYTAPSKYINGGWVCADKNFIIQDVKTNKSYKLIKANNIPICPEHYNFQGKGQILEFSLYFEPIHNSANIIDVIEGVDGGFEFYGVNLF